MKSLIFNQILISSFLIFFACCKGQQNNVLINKMDAVIYDAGYVLAFEVVFENHKGSGEFILRSDSITFISYSHSSTCELSELEYVKFLINDSKPSIQKLTQMVDGCELFIQSGNGEAKIVKSSDYIVNYFSEEDVV